MAEIELKRPAGYRVDGRRDYQVYIDRHKAGSIRSGESKSFALSPGRHELQLKIDWGSSERLQLTLGDNERAQFVCAPRVKQNDDSMLVGFILAYWMLFGFKRYIDLLPGDDIAAEVEPRGRLHRASGPMLFGIALLIAGAYWALTGQSIAVVGVVVGAMALVVGGLVGRGIGKATVQVTAEVQKHRDG